MPKQISIHYHRCGCDYSVRHDRPIWLYISFNHFYALFIGEKPSQRDLFKHRISQRLVAKEIIWRSVISNQNKGDAGEPKEIGFWQKEIGLTVYRAKVNNHYTGQTFRPILLRIELRKLYGTGFNHEWKTTPHYYVMIATSLHMLFILGFRS